MMLCKAIITMAVILVAACGATLAADLVPAGASPAKAPSEFPAAEAPGVLDCSGAVEVVIGNTYTGTTVGAPNNVSVYGCSPWNESGGEVVYRVVFPSDVVWNVSLTPIGCDLDLAVLDQCDADLGCLGVFDDSVLVPFPFPGEFFFVVDGYNGAACDFTITFETTPYEPPVGEVGDFCADVLQGTGIFFTGSTCDGANLVSMVGECSGYAAEGLEHYYEIQMPAGSEFIVDVTGSADVVLWILDGCAGSVSCLGFADDTGTGQAERAGWYNGTGSDTAVFLVIDGFGAGNCGDYVLEFSTYGGAVPTEVRSLGEVKALFR